MNKQRLKMMREDLKEFVSKEISDKGYDISDIKVRQVRKSEKEIEDFNTCIQCTKTFNLPFKVYVDLDETYGFMDIKALASQFVRYLVSNMKKDAFQIGSIQRFLMEKHPGIHPAKAYALAIKELRKLKRDEQDRPDASS